MTDEVRLVYAADHPRSTTDPALLRAIQRARVAAVEAAKLIEKQGRVPPGWKLVLEAPESPEKGPADAEPTTAPTGD